MNRFIGLVRNPVLGKEIRLRFRSIKSILGIFFYLFVLTALALACLFLVSSTSNIGADQSRTLFLVLTIGQMVLIAFMAPGLTAGVISGERERQTLNILLTTRQSSSAIVLSKLLSSLAFLALMVVSSLPLYAIAFLYGGISPQMVLQTFGVFLLTMFTFGSIGVLFSTLIRKTIVSMVTTYGIVLFLMVGTAVVAAFFNIFLSQTYTGHIQSFHPFMYMFYSANPIFILVSLFENGFAQSMQMGANYFQPEWLFFVELYLVISALSVWVSIRRLRPQYRSRHSAEDLDHE